MKIAETDLYAPLLRYFTSQGYIINNEVSVRNSGKRADIILTKPDISDSEQEPIGFELKTSLNLQVIDQAYYWTQFTTKNYIVVPKVNGNFKLSKSLSLASIRPILRSLGVGLVEIDLAKYNFNYKYNKDIGDTDVIVKDGVYDISTLGISVPLDSDYRYVHQEDLIALTSSLVEEHQKWAIGGSTSKEQHVTTYKLLMKDIYTYLRSIRLDDNDGWVTVQTIYDYIQDNSRDLVKNYYHNNPKTSIQKALLQYENDDIEHLNDGNGNYFRIISGSTKYLENNDSPIIDYCDESFFN